MPRPDSITQFLKAITSAVDLWSAIDGRTIAIRTPEGWHSFGTRIYLDPRPPEEVTRFPRLPSNDTLRALQWVQPIAELQPVIEHIVTGTLDLGGTSVLFRELRRKPEDEARPYSYHYRFSDMTGPYAKEYVHGTAHSLIGYGSATHDVIAQSPSDRDDLDGFLRTVDAPYDGISDLEVFFLGMPAPTKSNTVVGLELFAPYYVRLDRERSRLESGKLSVCVRAEYESHIRRTSVGVFGIGTGNLPVQCTLEPPTVQKAEDNAWEYTVTADLRDVSWIKLFLKIDRWAVDRMLVQDFSVAANNPRMTAYETIDSGAATFGDWLFPDTPTSKTAEFEQAVARLFTFLGFQVDSFASHKRLSEGVDALAHDPFSRTLLALECTTMTLDTGGKLGKLVARTRALAAAMPNTEVLPVIVTALPPDHLAEAEVQKAGQDGVAIVDRDGLAELASAASAGLPTKSVLASIRAMVPQFPNTSGGIARLPV